MIQLKYKAKPGFAPTRATDGSAGWDLRIESWDWHRGQDFTFHTGLWVEIPPQHVGLVFVRSSIGRAGWYLKNGTGVIDSCYRGEILLSMAHDEACERSLEVGDRIAQLVIVTRPAVQLVEVEELSETVRGSGGFGSSGK